MKLRQLCLFRRQLLKPSLFDGTYSYLSVDSEIKQNNFKKAILSALMISFSYNITYASEQFDPCDDWDFSRYMVRESKDLKKIFEVNEGVEAIKKQAKEKDVSDKTMTFLVGRTGAGKTKLRDLLNGHKLYAVHDADVAEYKMYRLEQNIDADMEVELQQLSWPDWFKMKATAKAEVWSEKWSKKSDKMKEFLGNFSLNSDRSHGYRPDTSVAELTGTVIDLPGIQNIGSTDSRKSAEIVRDSYEFKQLLREFKKFKLMVVVPEGDISVAGRAEKFLEVVTRLDEIFPDGLDGYKDRLFFVPSHAEAIKSPQIFKNRVKKMLEGRGEAGEKLLSEREETILRYVSNLPDDRICVFPRPSQNSVVNGNFLAPYIRANQQFPVYRGAINICVSESAKRYLEKMVSQPFDAIAELFKRFEQNLHFRVPPLLHGYTAGVAADQLRREFYNFAQTLEKGVDSAGIQKALDKIAPTSGRNFKSCVDIYERYMDLMPAAERRVFNVANGTMAYNLSKTVKLLAKEPRWLDSNMETVWGSYILGTSDIQLYLKRVQKSPFICRSTVGIVDSDVVVSGINWLWASTLLKMGTQQRVINLSGEHAFPVSVDPTSEYKKDGKDGKPGFSGQSGGHFVGLFDNEDIPYSLLEFKSTGGNGSKGQNGHDGEEGSNGKDEDPSIGVKATPGKPGQDAGRGGKGGQGGYAGSVRMLTFKQRTHATKWNATLNPGEPGRDGDPGKPGKGGINGCRMASTYWGLTWNPTSWVAKPVGWAGGGSTGLAKSIFSNAGAIVTLGNYGQFSNPISETAKGVRSANESVNDIFSVEKTRQEADEHAAPDGKRPSEPNEIGWVGTKTNPKVDEQTISRIINISNPYWEWVTVTTDYKEAQQ